MTTYKQLVKPNLNQQSAAGWCLFFVRSSFGVPEYSATATIAANKTRYRHATKNMPNAMVPVWFWHQGDYGEGWREYGHVVNWVPGRGFLSSPGSGFGQEWLPSIAAVEARFNCRFRFWSEDIGGVRVVRPTSTPTPITPPSSTSEEEDSMNPIVIQRTKPSNEWTRIHPTIGRDLEPGKSRKSGAVTVFFGYEATTDRDTGEAWARMHSDGSGAPRQRVNRAQYRAMQAQARRLAQFVSRVDDRVQNVKTAK